MQIYSSYDEEPEDIYLPLPQSIYSEMYELEMGSFDKDLFFYSSALSYQSTVLEVGCGSGRLTRLLSNLGHSLTGIDLSREMIHIARTKSTGNEHYIQMDMRQLAFNCLFDAVIIPYNTLNLLSDTDDIISCLNGCRKYLKPGGALLLQLYTPPVNDQTEETTKSFQFQMFDRPQGGRIVKEILRTMNYTTNRLEMTERYKVRPMNGTDSNVNYSHTLYLNGNDKERWLHIIASCNFTVENCYSSFNLDNSIASNTGLLLIKARPSR